MAQNLELIVGLLREMKKANNMNSESFDKLLASISSKIEVTDNTSASGELLKTYLSELAQTLDEKYSTTLSKFSDIENALISFKESQGKNKKFEKLFDTFTEEMGRFHAEANQQKVTIAGIEKIISTLNNDKLSKKDVDNATGLLKKDFIELNNNYKESTDIINEKLNTILIHIMSQDDFANNTEIANQIEVMHKAANEIVNCLTSIDRRDTNLKKLLSNTIANENLKVSQGIINTIVENADKIAKKISNLANKTDVKNLKTTVEQFAEKIDEIDSEELFNKINKTTDKILNQTDEVKQALAEVTKNIDSMPDTKTFEQSLQSLYKKLDELSADIEKVNTTESISEDAEHNISTIISELSTVRNTVSELYEIISNKISNSINDISFETQCFEIKSHISKMLSELPSKEEIEKILDSQDNIIEAIDNLATKQDIENITIKANAIEKNVSNLKFEKEFNSLYDKTSSIEEWLIRSKVKETSEEILAKIPEKAEQKDLIEILSTTKKIADELEGISSSTDVDKINSTVSEVHSLIEDLRNDFLNTTDLHNDSIISGISELQNRVSNIVTAEDFDGFVEDLKAFVVDSISKTSEIDSNITDIKTYQKALINKLDSLNFDSIVEILNAKNLDSENRIINISEFIEKTLNTNTKNVADSVKEIKEILENKNSNLSEIDEKQLASLNLLEEYIKDIKTILDTKDSEIDAILKNNFADIEEKIESRKVQSEENLHQTLLKIDDLSSMIQTERSFCAGEIQNSLSEIIEIKEQITELGKSFKSLNYESGTEENNISTFISDKLNELSLDLGNISEGFENKISQGFAYQAELIEEKTATLLELIKELRHNNSENIDLYERLTVTDSKLMDFKQELELVNTDIINNLNSKTEQIIADLTPIKETLLNIMSNNFSNNNNSFDGLNEQLQTIHDTIIDDLKECTIHSQSTYDKLEDMYTKISNEISANENNLRDFILGDIDSVIIKIDNLRSDLEESLEKIAPPEAENMAEFRQFVDEIKEFKQAQRDLITETAEDIKNTISEQLATQQKELKSILSVSVNNREILSAIESLKNTLKSRIQNYVNVESTDSDISQEDDFGINIYEKEFEQNANSEIIDAIKSDFDKFTELLNDLSDQNPEINEVLDTIKLKMESLSVVRNDVSDDFTISEEGEITSISDEQSGTIIGANNFDVLQALDLLKQDIASLQSQVSKIIPEKDQIQLRNIIPTLGAKTDIAASTDFSTKIESLAQTMKSDWLNEIQNYLANSEIHTLLEEINDKVNILTLTTNPDDVAEIKDALNQLSAIDINSITESNKELQTVMSAINSKIDILASTDTTENIEDLRVALDSIDNKIDVIAATNLTDEVEDIRFTLETIDSKLDEMTDSKKLSESDAKITSMLETLNHKIDIIASGSDTEYALEEVRDLILAQQDNIDNLDQNNKTEAFKKCLEELTQEVNNITGNNAQEIQRSLKDMKESIMSAVVTIFEQVSFIEESEDIKDFVEEKTDQINKNLAAVTEQLKQITPSDPDYTYSMQDIESDLAKLRIALNELQANEQDSKDNHLESILDNINQISSTVQGLQITSGESFNAINNFGKDITTYLSNKVDNVAKMVEQSHNSDKVMRQALIYMGEWIDSASESMEKISTNSEEIIDIKSAIDDLKDSIPEHTVLLSSIKNKFEEQEERIDRLEMALEKILSAVEDIDDTKVTRKIDKIDKQLLKLSTNIEKLASYVD